MIKPYDCGAAGVVADCRERERDYPATGAAPITKTKSRISIRTIAVKMISALVGVSLFFFFLLNLCFLVHLGLFASAVPSLCANEFLLVSCAFQFLF